LLCCLDVPQGGMQWRQLGHHCDMLHHAGTVSTVLGCQGIQHSLCCRRHEKHGKHLID